MIQCLSTHQCILLANDQDLRDTLLKVLSRAKDIARNHDDENEILKNVSSVIILPTFELASNIILTLNEVTVSLLLNHYHNYTYVSNFFPFKIKINCDIRFAVLFLSFFVAIIMMTPQVTSQ
jgi:hypothetical protein